MALTVAELRYLFTGDTSGLDKASKDADGTIKKLQSSARQLASTGRSLTFGLTLPVVGAGAAAVKMASDFQSSMQHIVGLVGESQSQVDAWSQQILSLKGQLPQSPDELAAALYNVTSSGIDASHAMDVVTASAKAAAAGLGTTDTVADAVTSAINAYGSANLTASQATDIMVATVRDGKVEADQLASVLGNVVGVAQTAGVSFDQVGAAIAAMSLTGQDAASAATSLQGLLLALIHESPAGAEQLSKVGLSYASLRQEVQEKGLLETLQHLQSAFGGNTTALQKVFPDVQALRGVLSLTGANAQQNADIFADLANTTGATDKAFASASQTAQFKLQASLSQVKDQAIQVGTALLPTVEKIAGKIADLANWFGHLSSTQQEAVLGAIGLAAALGPVLTVVSNFVRVFTLAGQAVKFFREQQILSRAATLAMAAASKVAAAGQWLLNIAMSANPLYLIILAVIALVAVFVILWVKSAAFRNFWIGLWGYIWSFMKAVGAWFAGPFAGFFVSLWHKLQGVWNAVWGVISVVINAIVAGVQWVWGIIQRVVGFWAPLFSAVFGVIWAVVKLYWTLVFAFVGLYINAVWTVIKTVLGWIVGYWQLYWSIVKAVVLAVWSWISPYISAAIEVVKAVISAAWAAISAVTSAVWNVIWGVIKWAWDQIMDGVHTLAALAGIIGGYFQRAYDAVKAKVDAVVSFVKGLGKQVLDAIGDLGHLLFDQGAKIIQGLIDGLTSKLNSLKDWLNHVTDMIPDWKGPADTDAALLVGAGQSIMGGLVAGIRQGTGELEDTLQGVTRMIGTGARGRMTVGVDYAGNSALLAALQGMGRASYSSQVSYNVYPQKANFTTADLNDLQREQEIRQRVGRAGGR